MALAVSVIDRVDADSVCVTELNPSTVDDIVGERTNSLEVVEVDVCIESLGLGVSTGVVVGVAIGELIESIAVIDGVATKLSCPRTS